MLIPQHSLTILIPVSRQSGANRLRVYEGLVQALCNYRDRVLKYNLGKANILYILKTDACLYTEYSIRFAQISESLESDTTGIELRGGIYGCPLLINSSYERSVG
jgi:hypothetical protein